VPKPHEKQNNNIPGPSGTKQLKQCTASVMCRYAAALNSKIQGWHAAGVVRKEAATTKQ